MKQTTVEARVWAAGQTGATEPLSLTLIYDGETVTAPEMDKSFVPKPGVIRGLRMSGWVVRGSLAGVPRIDITSTEMQRALDALGLDGAE